MIEVPVAIVVVGVFILPDPADFLLDDIEHINTLRFAQVRVRLFLRTT